MIELRCTGCDALLKVDDAFAGGVCRCRHCGKIQPVPAKHKGRVRQAAPIVGETIPDADDASPPSGLDELAEVVHSSGLSSGLRSTAFRESGPQAPETRTGPLKHFPLAAIAGAAAALVATIVIATLLLRSAADPAAPPAPDAAPAAAVGLPSFCGVRLDQGSVAYVLDRGSATQSSFDHLKEAAYRSIGSLGPERQFRVIFWQTDDLRAWPAEGMIEATDENLSAARRGLDDVFAFGQSDALPALRLALEPQPQEIVLATAKGWELDQQFAADVLDLHRSSPRTRIHTFSIGDAADSGGLREIAHRTGGTYRELTESEVRSFARN